MGDLPLETYKENFFLPNTHTNSVVGQRRQADCHSECSSLLFIDKAACGVTVIFISLLLLASQKISLQNYSLFVCRFPGELALLPHVNSY